MLYSDSKSSIDPATICSGSICPQVLSVASFEGNLHLFARTSDDHIETRVWDGKSWGIGWEDLGQAMDGNIRVEIGDDSDTSEVGKFISQPTAIAWEVDGVPRLSVFAVSAPDNTVWSLHREKVWNFFWEDKGSGASSQPVVCKVDQDRIDLWATGTDSHNIVHSSWLTGDKEFWSVWHGEGKFRDTKAGQASSAPGVVCRDDSTPYDLVWYDRGEAGVYGGLWNQYYDGENKSWSTPQYFQNGFAGDPALFSFEDKPNRTDFYGVGNNEVYHFSRESDEYSDLENLEGSIASSPSVVSPSEGVYDLVALGTDGKLKHKRYDDSTWSTEWDDLGVRGMSAPLAVTHNGSVFVFVLGEGDDGETGVMFWKSDNEKSWADPIAMESLGGSPSLKFFVEDS